VKIKRYYGSLRVTTGSFVSLILKVSCYPYAYVCAVLDLLCELETEVFLTRVKK